MSLGTILLIVLVIALLGGFSGLGGLLRTGYYGGGDSPHTHSGAVLVLLAGFELRGSAPV